MHSRVLQAERELERRLRTAAQSSLGPGASDAEIDAAVAQAQRGPQRVASGEESYVRRLLKNDARRLTAAQMERWNT